MNSTESIRQKLWCDVYVVHNSVVKANFAVQEFDKAFQIDETKLSNYLEAKKKADEVQQNNVAAFYKFLFARNDEKTIVKHLDNSKDIDSQLKEIFGNGLYCDVTTLLEKKNNERVFGGYSLNENTDILAYYKSGYTCRCTNTYPSGGKMQICLNCGSSLIYIND